MRTLILSSCIALLTSFTPAPPERDSCTLDVAVHAFNARALGSPIGRQQLPLTSDAVIAAVRWSLLPSSDLEVSDSIRAALHEVTRTRNLPDEFELEVLTNFEPDDRHVFEKWSVRLRVPGGPIQGGTTCVPIQERLLSSRVMGPMEREAVRAWRAQMLDGMGSLERGVQREVFDGLRKKARMADEEVGTSWR